MHAWPVRRSNLVVVIVISAGATMACGNGAGRTDGASPGGPASAAEPARALEGQELRAECETLLTRAFQAVGAVRAKHVACSADADCAHEWSSVCGVRGCGHYVAAKEKDQSAKEEADATREICGRYGKLECLKKAPPPMPSCAMDAPVCKDGKCDFK